MSVSCPKCNIPTKPFNLEADLYFDRCDMCLGMWLDKGELARTTGSESDWTDSERAMSGSASDISCPKCEEIKLYEVAYVPESKVIVEVCKKCEGLWLDSKELTQVQEILRKFRIDQRKKKLQSL